MRELHVEEVRCKTILNRSTVPFSDLTLNAYQGCAFGCSYCYVPIMRGRFRLEDERRWGEWVQVKVNAPEVLRREMTRVPPDKRISIGTATDSWQPLEKRYGIARRILEELSYYPNRVFLLTRSPLLIRDIDVLKRIPNVSIGVSLPTFDDAARKVFEPNAPAIPGRVHLVRRLVEAGLRVSLFWCPILYGVSDDSESVREYLRQASRLGVTRVVCDTLNYTKQLAKPHMQLLAEFYARNPGARRPSLARAALSREIATWADHYGIHCRL